MIDEISKDNVGSIPGLRKASGVQNDIVNVGLVCSMLINKMNELIVEVNSLKK